MTKVEVIDKEKLDLTLEDLSKVSKQYMIFQERSTEVLVKQMEIIAKMVDQIEKSSLIFHNEINKLTTRIEDLEQVIFHENDRSMH